MCVNYTRVAATADVLARSQRQPVRDHSALAANLHDAVSPHRLTAGDTQVYEGLHVSQDRGPSRTEHPANRPHVLSRLFITTILHHYSYFPLFKPYLFSCIRYLYPCLSWMLGMRLILPMYLTCSFHLLYISKFLIHEIIALNELLVCTVSEDRGMGGSEGSRLPTHAYTPRFQSRSATATPTTSPKKRQLPQIPHQVNYYGY